MWRELCVVALFISVLCAADRKQDTRQPRSADTFWISGRYGRSLQPQPAKNNRFFLSNRYGKRSSSHMLDPSADRWKKQFFCDCVPRTQDKRSVFRVSA